jgi:phosphoesterase RecJ-like protein
MIIPESVHDALEKGGKFILSTHVNPDADGVGASAALCWLLRRLGRKAHIVNVEKLPDRFAFIEDIFPAARSLTPELADADTWVVLDASRLCRTGLEAAAQGRFLVNVDHHADNERFGRCNWVDPRAPAVSEMIFWLIRECGYYPDREIAEALYTGMLIDTGGFKFSNTDSRAFRACAELQECGVDCRGLYQKVFLDKSIGRLRLEGEIMRGAALHFNGRVCVMEVTEEALRGAEGADLEGISNLPMQLRDIEVGVMFIPKGDKTKVCLRSNGNLNAGEMASRYGGGGHAAAAGCTLPGSPGEARATVLSGLSEYFK